MHSRFDQTRSLKCRTTVNGKTWTMDHGLHWQSFDQWRFLRDSQFSILKFWTLNQWFSDVTAWCRNEDDNDDIDCCLQTQMHTPLSTSICQSQRPYDWPYVMMDQWWTLISLLSLEPSLKTLSLQFHWPLLYQPRRRNLLSTASTQAQNLLKKGPQAAMWKKMHSSPPLKKIRIRLCMGGQLT